MCAHLIILHTFLVELRSLSHLIMEWFFCLLILVASLLQAKTKNVYYIQPTNHNLSDTAHYTLQGYINYIKKHNSYGKGLYNKSELLLLPGKHVIKTDFIIQNIYDFAILGNNSKIYCERSFLGIAFINVTRVLLKNVEIINCGKIYILKSDSREATNCTTAIYFNQCTDVNISAVHIMVPSGTNGMVAININTSKRNKRSVFQDIAITANCTKTSLPSNGILFYYHDYYSQGIRTPEHCEVQLSNYKYRNIGLCKNLFALNIATNQTTFDVLIQVFHTNFNYFNNSGVLTYHGESCGELLRSILNFKNCSIEHNQGDNYLKLFHIVISNHGAMYNFSTNRNNIGTCDKQINIINFRNCAFVNNSYMESILYVLLLNSQSANVLIDIRDSIFIGNYDTQIIKTKSKVKILWQLTHYIILMNTTISSNRQSGPGHRLISSANGLIKFIHSVIIKNNTYQLAIIQLYFSVLRFQGYSELSANKALFILDSIGGSYYILNEYSTVNITKNFVHSVMRLDFVFNDDSKLICIFQFVSDQNDFEEYISENRSLHYWIGLIDNVYSAPEYLIQKTNMDYDNCAWLDTAFSSTNSSVVYNKVIKEITKYANKDSILMTELSTICPCFNISNYYCSQRYIGSVFPGQTLTIKLKLITVQPFKTTYITSFSRTESMSRACHLLKVLEVIQEHNSNQCIEHNYTIWSELPECELYLSSDEGITETLYIKLRACPAGFVLHRKKQGCYCDPILYPYVTSCNLNDETILRPANSWVFAYQVNQKYEYKVSNLCPYNHCLPHPSHLNLSMPDSQCKFHRTGLLCGQCQQGLSTIFGSSQCKHCSNFYLFIIIPIAVAGVVLVIMLFIFNLTVTSGTINTFIFYVNIISINYSIFFPECHSIDCLLLSLSNLDLGFEMCFYNGMDDYFKALLQLVFPLYLIFIAYVLIIVSRHSVTIQRITSHRALHVLATLFLLSYTKFLLTVCQVLFFYSEIIHLPSKHIMLVWSLDVSIQLFGAKFLIAFLICFVIFIILLYFNVLLLFARQLLRFKYINSFKPLLDAYFGPYKDSCFYWTGLQLIVRAIFFGLSAFHRNVSLTSGIILLGLLLCLQGLIHPFKSIYKNIQEALIIFNLQAVYVLALYGDDGNANIQIIQVLILLVLAYFFIVVFYSCLMSTSTCCIVVLRVRSKLAVHLKMLKDKIFTSRSAYDAIDLTGVNNPISRNYHEFQESLIALDT